MELNQLNQISFDALELGQKLSVINDEQLNALEFGVIGFDDEGLVKIYNSYESKMAGLSLESVIDADCFNTVAPCMNNFLVAQKFEDSIDAKINLDEVIDYVLTLKMKPTKVKLRLMSSPQLPYNYLAILRLN